MFGKLGREIQSKTSVSSKKLIGKEKKLSLLRPKPKLSGEFKLHRLSFFREFQFAISKDWALQPDSASGVFETFWLGRLILSYDKIT